MGTKAKRNKPQSLSDQLREIIETGPMSRYELGKRAAVDASHLCKFIQGKARLTNDSLDRIGQVLRLRFVQDGE